MPFTRDTWRRPSHVNELKLTKKMRQIIPRARRSEKQVVEWLQTHGFRDVEKNPKPTGHWDVKGRKGKEIWIIEVKSGEKPKIDMANFEKMIEDETADVIGLALVTPRQVHLLVRMK